ncbi:uncharacterized protein LOC144436223 [Glandiceps talaboti]
MASSRRKKKVEYVYDIPPLALDELAKMLDPPGPSNWQRLASLMEFTEDKVRVFGLALNRMNGGGPFREMLQVWGYENHTVTDLFLLFSNMNHVRCMEVLKPYVDSRYHSMIPNYQEPTIPSSSMSSAHSSFSSSSSSSSSNWSCSYQLQMSTQLSKGPFVNKRGIDPETLPEPVPPPLTCTCGRCDGDSHSMSIPTSSSRLNTSFHKGHRFPKQPSGANQKTSQSSPLPANTVNSRVNYNTDPKSAYSFDSTSTTSCNLSTTEISESDFPSIGSIDKDLLHTLKSYDNDMKETKVQSPEELRERMHLYALIAMNHKKYKEIVHGTDDFSKENVLGEGAFGVVFKAVLNETIFAVKRLSQNEETGFEGEKYARKYQLNEIRALLKYRHINIVPLSFYSLDGPEPCLVYEYMHNGSLQDRLNGKKRKSTLHWQLRLRIATGSARGIQFLHTAKEKPLIHGDIKSANILLDKHDEPKIGDFGLAREGPNNKGYTVLKTETVHGTIHYLPPEFLRNWKLSTKVDTFSFGVVLFEILNGRMAYEPGRERPHRLLMEDVAELFDDDTNIIPASIVRKLRDIRCPDWPDEIVMDFINISRKCTAEKPKDRPEVVMVLKDLEKLQLKVQEWRDNRIGNQPVQNTEPYQLVEKVENETGAQPPKAATPDVPARVPEEYSDDSCKPATSSELETSSEQHYQSEECKEKQAAEQQEQVDDKHVSDLTLEEKAAIKQREIEGEVASEIAQKVEELHIKNVAMEECEIPDMKLAENPEDSGRYSASSCEKSKSESGEYAGHVTDNVNKPVAMEIHYQPPILHEQQNHGDRSPDRYGQMHRMSREPCESSDCSITRTQHDRFEGQNGHPHSRVEGENRHPQSRFEEGHGPSEIRYVEENGHPKMSQGQIHSISQGGHRMPENYPLAGHLYHDPRHGSPSGQYPDMSRHQMVMKPSYHPPTDSPDVSYHQYPTMQHTLHHSNSRTDGSSNSLPCYPPGQSQFRQGVYPANQMGPHVYQGRPQYFPPYSNPYYENPTQRLPPDMYAYNLTPHDMYQQPTNRYSNDQYRYDDGGMIDEYRPGDPVYKYYKPQKNSDPLWPNPMATQGAWQGDYRHHPRYLPVRPPSMADESHIKPQDHPKKKNWPYTPSSPPSAANVGQEHCQNRLPPTSPDHRPSSFIQDNWPQENYQQSYQLAQSRVNAPGNIYSQRHQEPVERMETNACRNFNGRPETHNMPIGNEDQQHHRSPQRAYLTQRSASSEGASDTSLPQDAEVSALSDESHNPRNDPGEGNDHASQC